MGKVLLFLLMFCCFGLCAGSPDFSAQTKARTSLSDTLVFAPKILAAGGWHSPQGMGSNAQAIVAVSLALETQKPKWSLAGSFEYISGNNLFAQRFMDFGFNRKHGKGHAASRWRGRWTWNPLTSVQIDVGQDTLSDGWGRRSMFRGRHVAPVPFVQVKLDGGGRLRYRHRIEALRGQRYMDCTPAAIGNPETWVPSQGAIRSNIQRMVVAHRLELDFGQRLTAALWGAVVWNTADGTRSWEPHYLIPLTSLRPTEYAQGSSDNALVGAEGRLLLGSNAKLKRSIYGQFVLDELIVSELLGGTQWWGNKFGLLGGVNWATRWGGWRVECAAARPWTYSHFTRSAAYVHGITPLAHPLGANFAECAFEGNWTGQGWMVHLRWTGSVRGDALDPDHPSGALPQIGDIHRTAETYAWLNGQRRHKITTVLDVAKDVNWIRNLNAQAFFQVIRGAEFYPSSLIHPSNQWWVGCGIRTTGPFLGADW